MKCIICNRDIPARGTWTKGNNAEPVAQGRCCYDCEAEYVLPARIAASNTRSMLDATENLRRAMIASGHPVRACAEAERTWNTGQLQEDFEVISFAAPLVIVRRKSDGKMGSMEFTHHPRAYFNFVPDDKP